MDRAEQRRIIEALILAAPDPVSSARLAEIVPGCKAGDAKDLVNELNTEYQEQDRSFEIWEVAGGYQIRTRAEFSGYLQQLQKQRPLRLSRAALDSLSIIAYKQPVTRAEIEDIRGVDAGAVLKGLLDRRLIRIAGQREVPGRPMLYGTTRRFLEVFGLDSLKGLPSLRELKELAEQKGVELPGSDEEDSDAPAQAAEEASVGAEEPSARGETNPLEEAIGYEVAEASHELEFSEDDLEEDGDLEEEVRALGQGESEEDDWEPPEIVEPNPES